MRLFFIVFLPAIVYQLLAVTAVLRHAVKRRVTRTPFPSADAPGVSVLKPVHGLDPNTSEAFLSQVQQSYPACAVRDGCVWSLAATSTSQRRRCAQTTRAQSWVSGNYSSAGEQSVPIAVAPADPGNGAICLYVNISTAQGSSRSRR